MLFTILISVLIALTICFFIALKNLNIHTEL